jgi:hypothetical protein
VKLLDPTIATDPGHLSFDYEGKAFPNPDRCSTDAVASDRATVSIGLYNLNHRGARDARLQLNRKLGRHFDDVARCLTSESPDAAARDAIKTGMYTLMAAVRDDAELSACARAYVRSRRGDSEVALGIVERVLA